MIFLKRWQTLECQNWVRPWGQKLDPLAGPFLVTFDEFLYTFLKACLNLGTFLGPFFGPTGERDFGSGCVQKKEFFWKIVQFFFEKMVDWARPGDQKLGSSAGPVWVTFCRSVFGCAGVCFVGPGRRTIFSHISRVENHIAASPRIVCDKKFLRNGSAGQGLNLTPHGCSFLNLSRFSVRDAVTKPSQLDQGNAPSFMTKQGHKKRSIEADTSDPQSQKLKNTQTCLFSVTKIWK